MLTCSSTARPATKLFLKGKYDICILDVMMPKKDGLTSLRNTHRQLRDTHHIPYGKIA